MLFNSYIYLLFLPTVLLIIKLLQNKPRFQHLILLIASNIFYGYWDYRFLVLIWVSTVLDFTIGNLLHTTSRISHRKLLVSISVIGNLSILGFFKYFDFFQESMSNLLEIISLPYNPWLLKILLPVGISFYTFQTMSYTIDVYRKNITPCKDLLTFSQFVCYFPQLVAGPIERAGHLIPQLSRPIMITTKNILSGLILIVWGLFKKAVIADLAGVYIVDPIVKHPMNGIQLWLALFAFAIQIYCDFSGYCDIARGTSRCFGIELIDNFKAPYSATSITDFWRRWHISLSTWFRDYLYIPLGGNRKGPVRTYFNLLLTMVLCGLWHGADNRYLLWGLYHGTLLLIHRIYTHKYKTKHTAIEAKCPKFISILKTCGTFILVCYGWLLFRVETKRLLVYTSLLFNLKYWFLNLSNIHWTFLTVFILAIPTYLSHIIQIKSQEEGIEIEDQWNISPYKYGIIFGLIIAFIFIFGSLGEDLPFIYFQF